MLSFLSFGELPFFGELRDDDGSLIGENSLLSVFFDLCPVFDFSDSLLDSDWSIEPFYEDDDEDIEESCKPDDDKATSNCPS